MIFPVPDREEKRRPRSVHLSRHLRRRSRLLLTASVLSLLVAPVPATAAPDSDRANGPRTVATNRSFDLLTRPVGEEGRRSALLQAGYALGSWQIHLSGVEIDGAALVRLASEPADEPLLRTVREGLRRPIDLDDFLLFLDDVLVAGAAGLRGKLVFVTSGRARKAGILVHPDDVFKQRPRRYGTRGALSIDQPKPQVDFPLAKDGETLGPNWTMRYRNPQTERELLTALAAKNRTGDFAGRVENLMAQLRKQGGQVYLNSTVRSRERGYLMWGAYALSRMDSRKDLLAGIEKLETVNAAWKLDVPIRWMHPAGWRETRDAAREMADTYDVVYATEQGARASNHYDGRAVDLTAVGLPRQLELRGSDGAERRFDLTAPEQTRDLSLSPELITWVEEHFELEKLKSDYPHWNDAVE